MLLFFRVITVSINALQASVSIIYLQKTEIFDFLIFQRVKNVVSLYLSTKSRQKEHFSLMT